MISPRAFVTSSFALLVTFASTAAITGCGSSSTNGTSGGGNDDTSADDSTANGANGATGGSLATSVCTISCDRTKTCGQSIDESTCVLECENGESSAVSRMRSDLQAPLDSCLQAASCADVLEGKFVSDCLATALASVGPTAAGKAFCTAYGSAQDSCGESIDQASCLSFAKPYGDSYLQQATACASKSCTEIDDCVNAVLDLSSN
jgi:hypothetical protein